MSGPVFSVSSVVNLRSRNLQLSFPQILDPITQFGGFLKFKSLRMLAHFKVEPLDRLVNLGGAVAFDVFQLQRHFEIIRFRCRHQRRFDRLDDSFRRDAVFAVINLLQGPSPLGFFDRAFHRIGNAIGIENRLATGVARGAANRLNQRGSGTQKAFFIGVENRNQRHFG